MKTTLLLVWLSLSACLVFAQAPLTSYSITNMPTATNVVNSARGFGSQPEFSRDTIYKCNYGKRTSGAGIERIIQGFTMAGSVYTKVSSPNGRPYSRVAVVRHPALSGNTINSLYEYSSTGNPNNYFEPGYVDSLENLINSFVCNRGSDNLFSNPAGGASTTSSIERIDLFIGSGIVVTNALKQGVLINERNGNDNFKAAAIRAVNGAGKTTALGTLLSVPISAWGKVGPDIYSTVLSRSTDTNLYLKPKQNLGLQRISGLFISFASLGITNGTTVYGVSIFPDDVTPLMDLVGLTNVPTNTSEASVGGGGIDLMAGGGYFVETIPLSARQLALTASQTRGKALLRWKADADMLTGDFTIERKAADSWVTVGRMPGATTPRLEWTEPESLKGSHYYRVTWQGPAGIRIYSNEIFLNLMEQSTISLHPNPATDVLTLNFTGAATGLRILNAAGSVVKQRPVPEGKKNLTVPVTDLTHGNYFLQLYHNTNLVGEVRFVRQ